MRQSLRRCFAAAMAVLLVSSAFGPVGTASAQFGEEPKNCGAVDKYIVAVTWSIGAGLTDCEFGSEVDPAEGAEADQVHTELYGSAITSGEGNEVLDASISNYLDDSTTIAKMEGKNGFIQSYDNGSSRMQALAAANQSIEDFYANHQMTVLQAWGAEARTLERIANSSESEQNLSVGDVIHRQGDDDYTDPVVGVETVNQSVELLNGTTVQATAVSYTDGPTSVPSEDTGSIYWRAFVLPAEGDGSGGIGGSNQDKIPDESEPMLNNHKALDDWQEIEDTAQEQQEQVADWSGPIYDELEAGGVSPAELVDPYLGAREYDPSDTGESWSTRSLTALGITPPENISTLERMSIVDAQTATTYEGTLMAAADPPNASGYAIGTTYNASEIPGHVFVASNDGPHELEGRFRIESAERINGSSYEDGETLTYERPDYETADLSGYKNLSQQVMEMRADFETREQNLEENASSGGGGGFGFGGALPFGGAGVAVVVLTLLGMAAVSRGN